MLDSWPRLQTSDFPALARGALTTLQLNLGYLCNISCIHCHVDAGPRRTELMDRPTMELALAVADRHRVTTLDLTGGSPEMNPEFRWLVTEARRRGLQIRFRDLHLGTAGVDRLRRGARRRGGAALHL